MNCNECQLKFNELIDNELAENDLTFVEIHLKQCVLCRQKLNQLKQIKLQINHFAGPAISPDFESKLERKIQQINTSKRSYIPWAVAATLIIMLSTITFNNPPSTLDENQELMVELQTIGRPILSENEFIQWTQVELDSNFRCSNAGQSGLCN